MPILTAVAAGGTVLVAAVFVSIWVRGRGLDVQYGLFLFHNGPPALLLFWLGRLVLIRQPGSRVGAVLFAIAALGALHVLVANWADVALVAWGYTDAITQNHPLVPAELPLRASVPFWIMNWLWVPQVVLLVAVLPLIFPDGRLPGPGWRIAFWLAGLGGTIVVVAMVIDAWPTAPTGVGVTHPAFEVLMAIGGPILLAAAIVAFAGLAIRWNRATGGLRQQFRVVGIAAGGLALVALATYPWPDIWVPAVLVAMYLFLTTYALAAARFRLHDLEPVLGKPAAASALSALATATYVALVLWAGLAAARRADTVVLPILSVGAAALLAEPVRRGVRRLIDRVLIGAAADRTEVVSRLARGATAAPSDAEMLLDVVELLVRSTGAERAEAWLQTDTGADLVASAGPDVPGAPSLSAPLVNQGQQLGELRLYARVAADLAPDARQVLTDVTYVLGIAVHNSRLTQQLRDQLADLQASRRRLVEAQDTARRGLERDLHDGAQSRLISLRFRLGALQARLDGADDAISTELDTIAEEVDGAVDSLRHLARGLYPPILDQAGLVEALRAHVRYLPVPVTVTGAGIGRHGRAVETAVYFSCLEALQNALRHSGARTITVDLALEGDGLCFTVRDDGTGFDRTVTTAGLGLTSIDDRVSSLGGQLSLHSALGIGTTVHGTIPVAART